MIRRFRQSLRRAETSVPDFLGCVALTILLIAGLHLPLP